MISAMAGIRYVGFWGMVFRPPRFRVRILWLRLWDGRELLLGLCCGLWLGDFGGFLLGRCLFIGWLGLRGDLSSHS